MINNRFFYLEFALKNGFFFNYWLYEKKMGVRIGCHPRHADCITEAG
jgi:hypothetical protein